MKTTLKLLFLLSFCLAAFCSMREFAFQINGMSISIPNNNAAPFFKFIWDNKLYYARLQSIYEIYQKNDSQWFKLPDTEVKLNSLNWNATLDWDNDTISLLGAPCPCLDQMEQQEQFLNKRHHLDNNNKVECPVVNFDYIRFSVERDIDNCSAPNLESCNATCVQNCETSENLTSCLNGCNAITDISFLDSIICDNACANDTICWDSCYALFDCLINDVCALKVNYHLNRYQWSNISDLGENITRKLVFSYKIVPQYDQVHCCGTQFDYWINGNYSLIFNTTTLSLDANNTEADISTATEIASNFVWALRGEAIFVRAYFDDLLAGHSLFNYYPALLQNVTIPPNNDTINETDTPQGRRNLAYELN